MKHHVLFILVLNYNNMRYETYDIVCNMSYDFMRLFSYVEN